MAFARSFCIPTARAPQKEKVVPLPANPMNSRATGTAWLTRVTKMASRRIPSPTATKSGVDARRTNNSQNPMATNPRRTSLSCSRNDSWPDQATHNTLRNIFDILQVCFYSICTTIRSSRPTVILAKVVPFNPAHYLLPRYFVLKSSRHLSCRLV